MFSIVISVLLVGVGTSQDKVPGELVTLTARVNEHDALIKAHNIRIKELEDKLTSITTTTPKKVSSKPENGVVVVPPGSHAHRKADGQIIVHSDSNYGDPAAHAGVPYPWPKVATAGQAVKTLSYADGAQCPVGGCPTTFDAPMANYSTGYSSGGYSTGYSFPMKQKNGFFGFGKRRSGGGCKNGQCPQ